MIDSALGDRFLSLDDSALLNRVFKTDDPEVLAPPIALGELAELPTIRLRYDVRPPARTERAFVWCGHCRRRTHWKGYVIELADGVLATLGHECGDHQFGFSFGAVQNAFDQEADRQELLGFAVRLRRASGQFTQAIDRLRHSATVASYDDARLSLKAQWPELWKALLKAERADGVLETELQKPDPTGDRNLLRKVQEEFRRELDAAKSDRRYYNAVWDQMVQTYADRGGKILVERKPYGRLVGRDFLELGSPLADRLTDIANSFSKACQPLWRSTSSALTNRTLKGLKREVSNCLEAAEAVALRYEVANQFWSRANLEAIAAWGPEATQVGLRWRVEGLQLVSSGGSGAGLVAPLRAPGELADLRAFRNAVGVNGARSEGNGDVRTAA